MNANLPTNANLKTNANLPTNRLQELDPQWAWEPYVPDAKHPWDLQKAAHLYRRAAFSGSPGQLQQAVDAGLPQTLDRLFDVSGSQAYDQEMNQAARFLLGNNDPRQAAAWWLLRMLNSPCPMLEKMTLFWHGHFATSAQKVQDVQPMLAQNQLLRQYALSHFEPLVQAISKDVAMLTYLDSEENRKTRPNENYARELMELFCLGLDRYSEQDIKEIARCFTGWEVRRVSGSARFRFNEHQHDPGTKTFLGQTGKFGGTDAVRIVVGRDDAKRFIARNLIRFFVFEDRPLDEALVEPVAQTLKHNDFNIAAAVRLILSSNLFFSPLAIGRKIRSPVELVIGLLHQLDATAETQPMMEDLEQMGQLPLFPPNVKGWEGGRRWLNASTLLARANFVRRVANRQGVTLSAGSWEEWASQNAVPKEPEQQVTWITSRFLPVELPNTTSQALVELLHQAGSADERASSLLTALGLVPEFQLS